MKSAMTKQAAIFFLLVFGWAMVAGAANIPVVVTTASQWDDLSLGISETLTTNVGTLPNGSWVNEIDVRMTGIGGTYNFDAGIIPSTAGINGVYGTWSFPGGVAYLASNLANGGDSGTHVASPTDGASTYVGGTPGIGNVNYPGYWAAGNKSTISFDASGPAARVLRHGRGRGQLHLWGHQHYGRLVHVLAELQYHGRRRDPGRDVEHQRLAARSDRLRFRQHALGGVLCVAVGDRGRVLYHRWQSVEPNQRRRHLRSVRLQLRGWCYGLRPDTPRLRPRARYAGFAGLRIGRAIGIRLEAPQVIRGDGRFHLDITTSFTSIGEVLPDVSTMPGGSPSGAGLAQDLVRV